MVSIIISWTQTLTKDRAGVGLQTGDTATLFEHVLYFLHICKEKKHGINFYGPLTFPNSLIK